MTKTNKTAERQILFALEYVKDFNGTRAAERAGFTGADPSLAVTASRILKSPIIKQKIKDLIGQRAGKVKIGALTPKKNDYVYLIGAVNGFTKIGVSRDVKQRFSSLNVASPIELHIIYYFYSLDALRIEKEIHEKFSSKRVKGEWFNLDESDIDWVKSHYSSLEKNTEIDKPPTILNYRIAPFNPEGAIQGSLFDYGKKSD